MSDPLSETRPEPPQTECTGMTASWCPIHGDCTCPRHDDGSAMEDWIIENCSDMGVCPLHAFDSPHAAPPVASPEGDEPNVNGCSSLPSWPDPHCADVLRAMASNAAFDFTEDQAELLRYSADRLTPGPSAVALSPQDVEEWGRVAKGGYPASDELRQRTADACSATLVAAAAADG